MLQGTPFNGLSPERLRREITSENLHLIPHGAAGLHLLGKFAMKSNQKTYAIAYLELAIQFDCYLFEAFESLTKLGGNMNAASEEALGFVHTAANSGVRRELLIDLTRAKDGAMGRHFSSNEGSMMGMRRTSHSKSDFTSPPEPTSRSLFDTTPAVSAKGVSRRLSLNAATPGMTTPAAVGRRATSAPSDVPPSGIRRSERYDE